MTNIAQIYIGKLPVKRNGDQINLAGLFSERVGLKACNIYILET